MTEFDAFLDKMQVTRADHLPVIAAFCNRIGLTETIDRVVLLTVLRKRTYLVKSALHHRLCVWKAHFVEY